MPTTYIQRDTASDLSAPGEYDLELLETTAAEVMRTINLAASATAEGYHYTDAGVPGADGVTGDYSVEVDIAVGDSNVQVSAAVARVNSSGTVQTQTAFSAEQTADGTVLSFSFTSVDLGTWATGDRLRVAVRYRNSHSHTSRSVDVAFNTVDSEVVAPWTIGATVSLSGSGANASAGSGTLTVPGSADFTLAFGQNDEITSTDFSNLANPAGEWYNNHMRPVWWNGFQSRWDGVLPASTAAGAATASDWWLFKDIAGTPALDQLVYSHRFSRPDVYWDETAKTLYVLMADNNNARLFRFDYDDVGDTYTVRSGDPITVPHDSGFKKAVLTKSPNGNLWVSSNSDDFLQIEINRSADDGNTWAASVVALKTTAASGDSHLVNFNDGSGNRVGIATSEDDTAASPIVHFLHIGEGDAGWETPGNWTDETASLPALSGTAVADDELSAAVHNDIVYITFETGSGGTGDDQLVVFKRATAGTWTKHVVHTVEAAAVWKRPVIVIDSEAGKAVVLATDPNTDETAMFRADVPDLASWSGPDLLFSGVDHYNPRTARGSTDATSDLLVLGDQLVVTQVMRQVVQTEATAGTVSLSGSGANAADGSGDLTVSSPPVDLSGSGANASDGSGALTVAVSLSGSGASASDGSGVLTVGGQVDLSGSGANAAAGTAALSVEVTLTGSGANASAGTSALDVTRSLSASGANASAGTADASIIRGLSGSGANASDGSGQLSAGGEIFLSGSGANAADGTGALDVDLTLSGSGANVSAGTGALDLGVDLSGAGAAASTGSGDLTVTGQNVVSLSGVGDNAATGSGMADITRGLAGSGANAAAAQTALDLSVDLAGAGAAAAAGFARLAALRALSGQGANAAAGGGTLDIEGPPSGRIRTEGSGVLVGSTEGSGVLAGSTEGSKKTTGFLEGSKV